MFQSSRARGALRRFTAGCAVILVCVLVWLAPAASALPPTEGFESGLNGWSTSGFWHVQDHPENVSVDPGINPQLVTLPDAGALPAAFGGTHVAWFGESSTGTFCGSDWGTPNDAQSKNGCTSSAIYSGDLISPSFSLAGVSNAQMSFNAWYEIESVAASSVDLMTVDYSTDGGSTWTQLTKLNPINNPAGAADQSYSNNGLEQSPSWRSYLVDLSAAAGQPSVQIRIHFDTVDTLYQGFRGLAVDDIAFGATSAPPPPPPPPFQATGGPVGPPPPVFRRTANVAAVRGHVFVRQPGSRRFVELSGSAQIPLGSIIDTRRGRVTETIATRRGGTESADFYDGEFGATQDATGLATETLYGGSFARCSSRRPRGARARTARGRSVRHLSARGRGHFRTRGRYAAATVRGTQWLTEDDCDGTYIKVTQSAVSVRDFPRRRTVTVRAPRSYLARAPGR